MNTFRIVPLDGAYANRIRQERKDDFGHEVTEHIAKGKGPCRVSLKPFKIGEDRRLLFSYSPFSIENAFNQTGPIFIHRDEVEPYSDVHRFPPVIKADRQNFPLTLIGYNRSQHMIHTQLVGEDDVDLLIARIFNENPAIDFLHARNAEAGCFICRIERV